MSAVRRTTFRAINWISRTFFASRLSFSHIQAFLQNNSWRKLGNLVRVYWEQWHGVEQVKSKPYLFIFEVTNICNLKCPFCVTGKGISGGRAVRHVGFEEAKRIIDAVGDYVYMLQLYTWGEPLLNKDIVRIIEHAKSKNIYVMLSTNATALTAAYAKKLLDSGIDYITVAIDGGSDETYAKYRVGGHYTKVLQNVKGLLAQRATLGRAKPFVEWQFVVFRHNEHEVNSTERMAYGIGIDKFTPLPAYVEDPEWAPQGERYKVQVLNPERLRNCVRPWTHLNVRADGGVAPCCYEFFKKDDFGELTAATFEQIWNNDKFRASRRLIGQWRRGEDLEQSDIICYECLKSGLRPSYIIATESDEAATMQDRAG